MPDTTTAESSNASGKTTRATGSNATTAPGSAGRSSTQGTQSSAASTDQSSTGSDLATTQGKTVIADVVVSKIAGIAAREVNGVHDLGGGTARVVGQLRERIPGGRTNLSQGVAVEVGERQAAVDIDIVADYGVAIADLAEGIRQNVIAAVQRMTGLEVTEVNVTVHDVFLEDEDSSEGDSAPAPSRVQ